MAPLPKTDEPFLVSMVARISDNTESPISKWQNPSRNLQTGNGRVRVVTVRTPKGVYKRPIVKVVQLLSDQDDVESRAALAGGMLTPENGSRY